MDCQRKEQYMSIYENDIVYINLTKREIARQKIDKAIVDAYLGGRGLASHLLLENLPADATAFDPENLLVFATGLFTGTGMISSSRIHICTKSPLTGYIGSSNGGGDVAKELYRCHIAAMVVVGKSPVPVMVSISDDVIEILEVENIWGQTTSKTVESIQGMIGNERAHVMAIGNAGENLCHFAAIMTGIGHFAGRTGTGAVMGSKNLKAISVYSSRKAHKSRDISKVVSNYFNSIKDTKFYQKYSTVGSTYLVTWADQKGAGSAKNYSDVKYRDIEDTAWVSNEAIVTKYKGCYQCPVKCKAEVLIDHGRHEGKVMERPDYEPLISWGSRSGNSDGVESIYLHELCNDYGVDSIEAGNIVAFAIDLFERGILTTEETAGLELTWGNIDAMEELLRQMVFRSTCLGNLLADGLCSASKSIGKGAEEYAFHVKGLSMTAMDPRGFKATALGYAVSSRGCDFTYVYAKSEYNISPEVALLHYGTENAANRLSEDGKALMVRRSLVRAAVVDSIGMCKLPNLSMLIDIDYKIITDLINAVSGFNLTEEELFVIGERIVNAERIFNIRSGATSEDDRLPRKFTNEPISEGESKNSYVDLDKMKKEFYQLMGWDGQGRITEKKLNELGLIKFKNS